MLENGALEIGTSQRWTSPQMVRDSTTFGQFSAKLLRRWPQRSRSSASTNALCSAVNAIDESVMSLAFR
ncbi:MAG: hypothetical protein H0W30_11930 [Gemmatimonadaceae bacterium]|nr:hypothetical protein [Gemmatimonadaceae bacterium]MDQ3517571.1 hypothetical protein [Gemmatimonadota bacterium]